MRNARRHEARFWRSTTGAAAVEFVLVVPIAVMLTIGAIYLSTMMTAASSLHFAVEDAARCRSIKTATCTDATSTQTYGKTRYAGPALTGLTFTATQPACGNQVVATGSYYLRTGLKNFAVPLSATACFPT